MNLTYVDFALAILCAVVAVYFAHGLIVSIREQMDRTGLAIIGAIMLVNLAAAARLGWTLF